MHASARQAAILHALEDQGLCRVATLADQLAVSGETIRRDVKILELKGLVERVHGAVARRNLYREPAFRKRFGQNVAAKQAIARHAAAWVDNGDTLMLDTGSTTAYVARALADLSNLMVVTNCSEIARTLSESGRNQVYMAGGEFRSDDSAVFGATTIAFVEQFRVRLAILSIAAISLEHGLMDSHLSEAEFSRAVISQAQRVMVVADHSKFGSEAAVKVCDLDAVTSIVTDCAPPPPFCKALRRAGVTLLAPEA